MVNIFDSSKLWVSIKTKRYYSPDPTEVSKITSYISKNFGGILRKGIYIQCNDLISCLSDAVVIKDHLCVLIKYIGQGAFGKVFKSYDLTSNKLVAVKVQPMHLRDIIVKQAMITKTNGIGLIDINSNIGPSFLADNNGYFILPLADTSFNHWLIQKTVSGRNDLVVKALIKIAKDLIKLHSSGKVHMDLKTDNVLVIDDVAYLADFGKVETVGSYIEIADANYREYPHCAPEYFSDVNPSRFYNVNSKFDLFSFGYLMAVTAKQLRSHNTKKELLNISSNIHRMNPDQRTSLYIIIGYLEAIDKI
jgi:serine/threonine protein kinase